VISELVANSVEHGRDAIQLSVEHGIAAIHGSVTDDGDEFDYTPPDLISQALRGRGLASSTPSSSAGASATAARRSGST
jgi:anti-sigma regulatory factor (Ser/Thr protein kinase)